MRNNKKVWIAVIGVTAVLVFGAMIYKYSNLFQKPFYGMQGYRKDINYDYNTGKKMSIEKLRNQIDEYIGTYNENLEIADIFVYEDTDYYFSIEEARTGRGAMELLVNPYTGDIYPEHGPNMMWNQKYGMHSMNRDMVESNMMNGNVDNNYMGNYSNEERNSIINTNQAVNIANQYVKQNINNSWKVTNEGHKFYGYYTFHVNSDNNTIAMLSVNYYTGEVWYHDWHGKLEKIISHHE